MLEWRYADQILYVDLTARTVRAETTALELKRSFVGGAGFVAGLLAAKVASPGDVALATGPLSEGMAGRLSLGVRPRSGGPVVVSSLGGNMAAALKESGYDAMVLTGLLDRPGYLVVDEAGVEFRPAGALWGLEVSAAEAALEKETGGDYATIVLGPAAEHEVPFATLAHEGHFAGGSGVAAAVGAMGLKALLVRRPTTVSSRCTGCTLACPGQHAPEARLAGELGLDAPTAARLVALAERCAREGLLPSTGEPLVDMAHGTGVGRLLSQGEAALLSRLGPAAVEIAAALPPVKRRKGPGVADLLGTCQRVWRDRPGQVLREALSSTRGLLSLSV